MSNKTYKLGMFVIIVALAFSIGLTVGEFSGIKGNAPCVTVETVAPAVYITIINEYITDNNEDEFVIEYETEIYEVTAYTAGAESTGKTPDHPLYGITASGLPVEEGVTIACPPSMPFGTNVYIPYFDNEFTCYDRGSAITEGHLDVYMADLDEALAFGRRNLEVRILSVESEVLE